MIYNSDFCEALPLLRIIKERSPSMFLRCGGTSPERLGQAYNDISLNISRIRWKSQNDGKTLQNEDGALEGTQTIGPTTMWIWRKITHREKPSDSNAIL